MELTPQNTSKDLEGFGNLRGLAKHSRTKKPGQNGPGLKSSKGK